MEDMPPGFRFYPTEEELVSFFLRNKLDGNREDLNHLMNRVIPVVDIYEFNPWDLPQFSVFLCHKDPEQWFFFIPRGESEARGGRPKRLTTCGYWKATGSPGYVYSSLDNRPIGVKRTMVFYNGRAPSGKKTEWKMNEYKAIEGEASSGSANGAQPPAIRQEFSLCRVYKKSKCLRSFDRRPPPPPPPPGGAAGLLQLQIGNEADVDPQIGIGKSDQIIIGTDQTVDKTSSPESSSSGDHHHRPNRPTQIGESNVSSRMAVDECPFWDLDGFWDSAV